MIFNLQRNFIAKLALNRKRKSDDSDTDETDCKHAKRNSNSWKFKDPVQQNPGNIARQSAIKLKQDFKKPNAVTPKKLDIHFSKRRLFVTGLPLKTENKDIIDYFSKYGEIEDISRLDNELYAFITFKYYTKFPPVYHKFNGREIKISEMNPYNHPNLQSKTIVVNGVLTKLSDETMKKYFAKYGRVESIQVISRHGVKRCAIITFNNYSSVEEAIKEVVHMIEGHLVDIRKAR